MATSVAPVRISLQNILFATDFSSCSETALPYALGLAHRYGAGLYTVHVVPPVAGAESLRDDAEQEIVALAATQPFGTVKHRELIEEGEISAVLSSLVRQHNIDLIVLGTRGRKGISKLVMGSVAEDIFRLAECPVLTVGPHVPRRMYPNGDLKHVLFATDFGRESLQALPHALSFAREYRANFSLLHVAPVPSPPVDEPPMGPPPPYFDPRVISAVTLQQLRDLVPEETDLWCEPEYFVEFGMPAETILRVASEESVGMIVLGVRRPKAWTPYLATGTAYKVVCHAPCPVLSVGPAIAQST
ncbi:MAG: universal stress protein [Terriglobales bacterium]